MNQDVFKRAFGAKGDVFGAKGVIYAKGDVFGAKGRVKNAKGDVFRRASDSITGLNRMETDIPNASQETLSGEADKKGFFYYLEKTLGVADKVVDIRNKWESGVSSEQSGVEMNVAPNYETPKKDNTIWYIGAVVLGVLIVVGVIYARKGKTSK